MLISQDARTSVWGTAEVAAASSAVYDNPFRDVEFTVTFVSPSGAEVRATGFHDGGSVWRARLMPSEAGEWRFSTASGDSELDGHSGSISVSRSGGDARGPVRIVKDRHFAHADGTPYFLLGTTVYMGISSGRAELNRTISKLADSPFNKARFMVLGSLMTDADSERPFLSLADGSLDYTRPNPAFYRDLEQGIAQLQALGVEADLIFFLPYFDMFPPERFPSGPPSNMGRENDEWYIRYAVSRLAAYSNVWWTLANEFDLLRVQKDWDGLASAVTEADPYAHLLSVHHSILGFFDNSASWVTHANLQDVLLQRHAAGPRNLGELSLDAAEIGKPVVVDEYGYEGNNGFTWGSFTGPEMVEMHWAATLAGAYASHGESFADSERDFRFAGDAVERLGFLRDVMAEAPYQDMVPANEVVDYSGTAFVPTALAKAGEHYLVYFPVARELPDWNLGNFGPATPSKPLPLTGDGQFEMTETAVGISVQPGRYRVDLIDPWRQRIRTLGVTEDSSFTVHPRLTPGILRLVREPEGSAEARPMSELLGGGGFV